MNRNMGKSFSYANGGKMSDYLSGCSDEELVGKYRSDGCQSSSSPIIAELICRYFAFIKKKASECELPSSSWEDLVQEGLLGFVNAVNTFDENRKVSFSAYAYVCVVNRIRTACKKLSRDSMESSADESEDIILDDKLTPESIIMQKELMSEVSGILSENENRIFSLYISGMNCGEIAEKLNISPKSADNAIQRAKKKLRKSFG